MSGFTERADKEYTNSFASVTARHQIGNLLQALYWQNKEIIRLLEEKK